MSKEQVVQVPLSQLQQTFFVRQGLNDDHTLHLAELYEAGVELPPLKVVRGTLEIIDGRHRKAALELLNKDTAPCTLIEPLPFAELLAMAFKANEGQALPPTRADINLVMRQLIEQGVSVRKIIDMFDGVFPPSLCRKYDKDAQSAINKAKVQQAITAVAEEGMTVPKASEKFGVDEERLKAEIEGKKSKRRGFDLKAIRREISGRYKGNTLRTAAILREMLEKYEDGILSAAQVEDVLDHVDHMHQRATKTNAEWRTRFEKLKQDKKS